MADIKQITSDPFFSTLSQPEQVQLLNDNFPDFQQLSDEDKVQFLEGNDGNFFVELIGNVPKSGAKFVEDMISPFLSPVETAKAIGNLAVGVTQKFTPGVQDKEVFADSLFDFMKQRYGSASAFKETLKNDPVGVAGDLATILTGAGGAVRAGGKVATIASQTSRAAQTASKVGKAISKAGSAIEPLSVARKLTVETARPFIQRVPSRLYESAVKFSTIFTQDQRAALTKTALDNEIMPTVRGLDKLRNSINELNDVITQKIDAATEAGVKIDVKSLSTHFKDLQAKAKEFGFGSPEAARNAINKIRKELFRVNTRIESVPVRRTVDTGLLDVGGQPISKTIQTTRPKRVLKQLTPKEVQRIKQNIYFQNESLYSKTSAKPASTNAQAAIARSAKESLEEIFPEIKLLNKKEGAMIELNNALERAAGRIANRDIWGIGVPIKGTAGGSVAGPTGLAIGIGIGLLDAPTVKAKLAIVANRLARQGVAIGPTSGFSIFGLAKAPQSTIIKTGAFQSGRAIDQFQQEANQRFQSGVQ